jgi:membrane protease subunit HflC
MSTRTNLILLGVLGLLLLVFESLYIVDQRSRALLFEFGEVKGEGGSPGLHFKKPFIDTIRTFSARALTLDPRSETVTTADKRSLDIDFDVKWKIDNLTTYYRATGGQELVAGDLLAAIVIARLRENFGALSFQQALSNGDAADFTATLLKGVDDRIADLGIKPIEVRITGINVPKDSVEKVYERMRAERARVASDLRARGFEDADRIRAEADRTAETTVADAYRDAEKLRGEGDAKAAEISAMAYGQDPEFYAFYRSLSAYREAFKDRQDVLVVEPKGEFFKYFKRADGGNDGK